MRVVCVPESAMPESARKSIFLAGPSPRTNDQYNWRPKALEILFDMKFDGTVFVPLTPDWGWATDQIIQMNWELKNLERSTVIAFWIPRDLENLPGFTTNVEFGLFAQSGKVVLGYPKNAPQIGYLHHLADRFNISVRHSLQETLVSAATLVYQKLR